MGCLTTEYKREDGTLQVTFAPECGSSFGIPLLFDADGRQLFDGDGEILIANY